MEGQNNIKLIHVMASQLLSTFYNGALVHNREFSVVYVFDGFMATSTVAKLKHSISIHHLKPSPV